MKIGRVKMKKKKNKRLPNRKVTGGEKTFKAKRAKDMINGSQKESLGKRKIDHQEEARFRFSRGQPPISEEGGDIFGWGNSRNKKMAGRKYAGRRGGGKKTYGEKKEGGQS